MFAIIQTGGKQYKVNEGDVIFVEKLGANEGDEVKFDSKQIKANAKNRFREEAAAQIPTFANGDTHKYKEVVNKLLGETCL